MRPQAILACALSLTALVALPAAQADPVTDNLPSCTAALNDEGTTGAGCRLASTCYAVMWGYHTEFLTVGGGSSCSGGVWVNPNESPEDPVPSYIGDVCLTVADFC